MLNVSMLEVMKMYSLCSNNKYIQGMYNTIQVKTIPKREWLWDALLSRLRVE